MLVFFPNSFNTHKKEDDSTLTLPSPIPTNHAPFLPEKQLFYLTKTQQPSKIYKKRNTCKIFLPINCPRQGSSGTHSTLSSTTSSTIRDASWMMVEGSEVYSRCGILRSRIISISSKKGWRLLDGPEHHFTPLWLYYMLVFWFWAISTLNPKDPIRIF